MYAWASLEKNANKPLATLPYILIFLGQTLVCIFLLLYLSVCIKWLTKEYSERTLQTQGSVTSAVTVTAANNSGDSRVFVFEICTSDRNSRNASLCLSVLVRFSLVLCWQLTSSSSALSGGKDWRWLKWPERTLTCSSLWQIKYKSRHRA